MNTNAAAFLLFWILGAALLILGWSGSHCTPHAIRIGQLWSAYSFLCLATIWCTKHTEHKSIRNAKEAATPDR